MALPYSAHSVVGMASPYNIGEISNSTTFQMPDGSTRTALNDGMARDIYAQLQRAGGGGGGRSGGGNAGSIAGAYGGAYNAAKNANENRYNDILAGFDELMGGKRPPQKRSTSIQGPSFHSHYQDYRNSGSGLGYMEWRALQAKLERTAAQRGGVYGGMDASGVYPRMYGNGEFLGAPPSGQQPLGGAYGQRPQTPPPVYPTYTPLQRQNVNY